MDSTPTQTAINYPAVEIYVLIAQWCDEMHAAGKSLDPDADRFVGITRYDVGGLNQAIREAIEKHNYVPVNG